MLDEYAEINISKFIKSLPDTEEVRNKALELNQEDFSKWFEKFTKIN